MAKTKALEASKSPSLPTIEGTCTWFHLRKGYGFLKVHGEEMSVFVHVSNLAKDEDGRLILPLNGGRVRFSYERSQRPDKKSGLQVVKGTKIEVIDRYVPEPRRQED